MVDKDGAPSMAEKDGAPSMAEKDGAGDLKPSMAEKDTADDRNIEQRIRDQYAHMVDFLLQCEPTIDGLMKLMQTGMQSYFDSEALKAGIEPLEQHHEKAKKDFDKLTEMMTNDHPIQESEIRQIEEGIAFQGNVFIVLKKYSSKWTELLSEIMNFLLECEKDILESEVLKQIRNFIEKTGGIEKEEEGIKKELMGLGTEGAMLLSSKPLSSKTAKDSASDMNLEQKIRDRYLIILKKYSSKWTELLSEMMNFLRDYEKDVIESEVPKQIKNLIEKMGGIEKEEERAKKELIGLGSEGAMLLSSKPSSSKTEQNSADDMNLEQKIRDQYIYIVHYLRQYEPTLDKVMKRTETRVQRYADSEPVRAGIKNLEQDHEELKKEFKKLTEMMSNDHRILESRVRETEEGIAYQKNVLLTAKNYLSGWTELSSEILHFLREYEKDILESGDPNAEVPKQFRDLIEQISGIEKEEEIAKKEVIVLGTEGETPSSLEPSSPTAEKDGADGMKYQKENDEEPKNLELILSPSNPSTSKKDRHWQC